MNSKKFISTIAAGVIAATTIVTPSSIAFGYSSELESAYTWAYENGVTTVKGIDNANMMGNLTRVAMAKMLANYAINKLGRTPDTSITCNFSDVSAKMDADYDNGVTKACQLGIMGRDEGKVASSFNPNGIVTRAQFGTALSRVLWPNQVKDTNPYYVNHLNALKKAGIMTQINPDQKEVRGYVMIMLQRSAGMINNEKTEECSVAQQFLCILEEGDCPEACEGVVKKTEKETKKDEEKEEKKSGKITVTNEKNEDAVVLSQGYESELDTVVISTDEDITLNSMTFERYGYSTADSIDSIWLENENGEKVTTEKSLSSSKDAVTLNIKKDYKDLKKGKHEFVVVVKTTDKAECGETPSKYVCKSTDLGTNVGFTITSIDSSAETEKVNVSAKAYLYNFADYTGEGSVTVEYNGSDKNYSYVDGNSYEVAKVKIKAGSAAVKVNGFTLSNVASNVAKDKVNNFDLDKISNVEILADGEKLNKVSFSTSSKKDEMTVTFPEQEIAIKKSTTFTVRVTLEDVEDLGEAIAFVIDEASDLNVTESKTSVRAKVDLKNYSFPCNTANATYAADSDKSCYTAATTVANGLNTESTTATFPVYTIIGSKVTLTNSKIDSTIEAAAGSSDVVIASGSIALNGQAITIADMTVLSETAEQWDIIESVRLLLNGHDIAEFTKKKNYVKSFDINEDGTLQLVVDLEDNKTFDNKNIQVTIDGSTAIKLWRATYQDLDGEKNVNVNGSIVISAIKVTPAKSSFVNDLTKSVEFKANKSNEDKVVFSGSLTAKKSDLVLEGVTMTAEMKNSEIQGASYSFDVYVGKDNVATLDFDKKSTPVKDGKVVDNDTIDSVTIKQGDTATIKVIAHIYHELAAGETAPEGIEFNLTFDAKDGKGNEAAIDPENLVKFDIVESNNIEISNSVVVKKSDVILTNTDRTIGGFYVTPKKGSSSATIDAMKVEIENLTFANSVTIDDGASADKYFRVLIGGDDVADKLTVTEEKGKITLNTVDNDINIDINAKTEVIIKAKKDLEVTTKDIKVTTTINPNVVNSKSAENTRQVVKAFVRITKQTVANNVVSYTYAVETADNQTVSNLQLCTDPACKKTKVIEAWDLNSNGGVKKFNITDSSKIEDVVAIQYTIDANTDEEDSPIITIADFLKTDDDVQLSVYDVVSGD